MARKPMSKAQAKRRKRLLGQMRKDRAAQAKAAERWAEGGKDDTRKYRLSQNETSEAGGAGD